MILRRLKLVAGGFLFFARQVLAVVGLIGVTMAVWGQTTNDLDAQRRQSRQDALDREQQQALPAVRMPASAVSQQEEFDLPEEPICFPISAVEIRGVVPARLSWVVDHLAHYRNRCIGQESINLIVKRLGNRIVAEGYVTTRVAIPAQDLSSGILSLALVPGIVRAIRYAEGSSNAHWQNAFPVQPGDLLNIRDLEQGLEQLKRIPSQDAEMDIVPGDLAGESDIVLRIKRSKPWRLEFGLNDSGLKATGKRQATLTAAWDNPLGLNDLLSANVSRDAGHGGERLGSEAYGWQYSIPWDYWTFGASENFSNYHQTVDGINQSFITRGTSHTQELKVQRLLWRGQYGKTTLQFRSGQRNSRSFVADTEIEVQRQRSSFAEVAILQRQYLGAVQLDVSLARRNGVPWFGGDVDPDDHDADSPTYAYRMTILDVGALANFQVGRQPVRWIGALRMQDSRNVLFAADQIAIGNRYTVRGFDGEHTLSGEHGGYLRNEFEFALAGSGQSAYAAIDYGRVGGPSAELLAGTRLAGGAIGLRGVLLGANYDFFISSPISKPEGFSTARPATGFQISYPL